jgi:hypothetical protein
MIVGMVVSNDAVASDESRRSGCLSFYSIPKTLDASRELSARLIDLVEAELECRKVFLIGYAVCLRRPVRPGNDSFVLSGRCDQIAEYQKP